MRDWEALVQPQLAGLALEPEERAEVIAEVGEHLEDVCEEMCRQGITEEEAVRRALSQAGDWQDLQRKILMAKRGEISVKIRARQLWIPGFLTLILSTAFLMTLQQYGFRPRIVWSDGISILLYTPWLLSLPFFGALASYVSSRAGGSRGTALLASVFPALALTAAFLLMFPIGRTIQGTTGRQMDFSVVAATVLRDGISWIALPGAALSMGGLLVQLFYSPRSPSLSTVIG